MFLPTLPPHFGYEESTNTIDPWPGPEAPYDKQVKYWCNAAYEEATWENKQSDEVRQLVKGIDYLAGKQWPGQRPIWKSRPINNRIWRLFWELVATLTDVRPLFNIKALNPNYTDQAELLNKVTKSWWMEADADLTLSLVIVYGLLCTGYAKLEWNPRARNGEGDFDFIALSPNEVFALKARNSLESAQAIIYAIPKPVNWFRQKFPIRGWKVRPDALLSRFTRPTSPPNHLPPGLWDMLSPGMKRVMADSPAIQDSVFPMAMYREFWFDDAQYNQSNRNVVMGDPRSNWFYTVKPGEKLYPRGRLIVMGGEEVMHDGPNPYWHGRPPFAALRLNVVPWQFHGLSELAPLIPLQDIINNILAGVLDMVKKAVNPPFISQKGAFSDAAWNAMDWGLPGAKAQYSMNVSHAPQWGPTPNLPAFVMVLAQSIAREMDSSSGIATVAEAVRKKQVPAADTLESMKQSQQTPLRLKGRNIESFLRRVGQMNVPNIFQFYDARRRMFMLGKDGITFEDLDWDPGSMIPAGARPEDHVRNFAFMIHPGSLLNINQVERNMLLLKLRSMHDLDRKNLYKQLDLGIDPSVVAKNLQEENSQQLAQALAARMAAGGAGGGPVG
jgi:hypothetical protein